MTTLLLPNNSLVGVAWVKAALGLSGDVGTKLPAPADIADTGFVQLAVVGGSADINMPRGAPVFAVDCWAAARNSRLPVWGVANQLCEQIRYAVFAAHVAPIRVTLPSGYAGASVQSAVMQTEPMPMEDDPSSYARFRFHLQMWWTGLSIP